MGRCSRILMPGVTIRYGFWGIKAAMGDALRSVENMTASAGYGGRRPSFGHQCALGFRKMPYKQIQIENHGRDTIRSKGVFEPK